MTAARTPAIDRVVRAGVTHVVRRYEPAERHGRDRSRRPAYGLDAAEALGVEPSRVLKTLAVEVDGSLVLAVVPADRELDLKRLASAAAGRRASLADPATAERATGSVVGGISPLGSRRALPVIVDRSVMDHPTVLVSAGRRGLQLELAPADLVRLCSARSAGIARDEGPG